MARSAFLAIGGVVLVITGVALGVANARFLAESERAEGSVVELETQHVRGTTLYRPVVRFRPVGANESLEFTAKPGLWPSPHEQGDRVLVAYRRSDPIEAKIVSFWMLWFLPLLTALFGMGCVFAGWHDYQQVTKLRRTRGEEP